jgi:Ca-activated chloride channel family protein
MTFEKINYLAYILIGYFVFISYSFFYQKKYFQWIKDYWSMRPKKRFNLSLFLYALGFLCLALALMDLRGKPIIEKGEIPDQRTIILIDASSSMLAEDIKPNRYLKALTIARMFIKSAVGHQISVVVFSDVQKKIVPFTDDIDLLDSRVSGLSDQDIRRGGSNLKQAMQETVSYFLEDSSVATGNLIVLTDAEDNGDFENVSMPDGLTIAFVGVGTLSGSTIPLRSEQGGFENYKMHKGEKVVTRLDESLLKALTSKIKNSKYWIATSYSMPIDEIINFFKNNFSKKIKNDVKSRPARFEILMIPGFCFLLLSLLLSSFGKTFRPITLVFLLIGNTYSKEAGKKVELGAESESILKQVKSGELNRSALLDVAEELARKEKFKEAQEIYKDQTKLVNKNSSMLLNYGTTQMQRGEFNESIDNLKKLESLDPKLTNNYKKNLLTTLMKQKGKEEQEKKDKQQEKKDKEQEKKDGKDKEKNEDKNKKDDSQKNKDDKNDKDGKEQDNNKDKKGESGEGDQKDKEKNKEQENKSDEQKKKEQEQKDKEEQAKNKKEQEAPKSLDDKENKLKQSRKMVKVPALLQQLMNDDRNLQKKYIDTDTFKKNIDDKDW